MESMERGRKYTWSPHLLVGECMAAIGTGFFVFTDKHTSVQDISSVQIQPKSKQAKTFGQFNYLTRFELCMHFISWRQMPWEQAGTEGSCSKSLVEHHYWRNPASDKVYGLQTTGSRLQPGIKSANLIYDYGSHGSLACFFPLQYSVVDSWNV